MLLAWQGAGVLLGAAGIASLYGAWQRKDTGRVLTVAGWALVAAAILAWSRTSGIDKGPALGIVSTVLIALAAVAISALRTPVRPRRAARARMLRDDQGGVPAQDIAPKALTLVVLVLMGFAGSLGVCAALFMAGRSAGFEHTGNLALAMFAFPLVWAGLATWIGYTAHPARGAAMLATLLAAALAITSLAMWGA